MNKQKLLKHFRGKIDQSRQVESMMKSKGWEIFNTILDDIIDEVKEKDNYKTIQDFKADRKAIKIVRDIISDLEAMVNSATDSNKVIEKLKPKKRKFNSLSIDGE